MKQSSLFHRLTKSYVLFMLSSGAVCLLFAFFMLRSSLINIEISLGWLLVFLLLIGMNVAIYSLWTAKRITRPLETIAKSLQGMAEGQYHQRLAIDAGYEFSIIQQHFNALVEKLQQAQEENARLENSKQQMLADLSHDLRTPITTIQGYAKALQLGYAQNEEKRAAYIELIYNKSIYVTSLVEQIFNLATLNRADYPYEPKHEDIAELLREIAAHYYDQFLEKSFSVQLDIAEAELLHWYDPVLMRRAISNLLSNALVHNPPGTSIALRLAEAEQHIEITITDDGEEIPDAVKPVLFDSFIRGDVSRKSGGGSGLGLSIANKIVGLHQGTLTLHTANGCKTFTIRLPRLSPPDQK